MRTVDKVKPPYQLNQFPADFCQKLGYEKGSNFHRFTWQPHGSQFTIIESVPKECLLIKVKSPQKLDKEEVGSLGVAVILYTDYADFTESDGFLSKKSVIIRVIGETCTEPAEVSVSKRF